MKRRTLSILLTLGLVAVLTVVGALSASAHECWDKDDEEAPFNQDDGSDKDKDKDKKDKKKDEDDQEPPEGYWEEDDQYCRDTPVKPNWRDNYVPLFELEDREDEDQRRDAQRWREECSPRHAESHQGCTWSYGGFSLFNGGLGNPWIPGVSEEDAAPNEWHAGFGMNHCGAFEWAHQCEDHGGEHGEGVHDAHGGAIYVDVCLTENPESKYCDDGLEDTQAGMTIMDHFGCGVVVPIASCTDEYYVVRPLDQAYTQRQVENSQDAVQLMLDEPDRWLCGHHGSGQSCRNDTEGLREVTAPAAEAWSEVTSQVPAPPAP